MAALTLKINVVDLNLVKTMTFDAKSSVHSACEQINKKLQDTSIHKQFKPKEYGLYSTDDDPRKGAWLEPGRTLEYYMLKDHSVLEFKSKMRTLRVRMLDGTVKTVFIDDSQPVANLMVVICTKIGITNHDEYSLVRENTEKDKENVNNSSTYSSGTLTLKKNKDRDRPLDNKMEQLKKKLKTDDDLNWLDLSKTLREQGIEDDETLLLRRKFFYSDQNIDSRDPVQLNLLYVQTRDAIIQGTHPVTIDQACQFAGIQCQIQFGNFDESKHKPGYLDLKDFLPRDYVRMKHIEKRIFAEHAKYTGNSDLDAKVLYVKLARSLKTYGVTFFLVKEKMQGKNKLVPRLLGVTKDSVLRLDEQSKNILETWPLNTVKRWAASPNSFTLDFGDYKQSYFSVQTSEGEQISQLIAGYIDIILKRKKAFDHFGITGDEGSTMVEDSVSPYKATILQHQSPAKPTVIGSIAMPAVMRLPQQEPPPIYQGSVPETRVTTIKGNINIGYAAEPQPQLPDELDSGLTDGHHALISVIEAAKETIKEVEKELEVPAEIPDLGEDTSSLKWKQVQLDVKKQNVISQLHAIGGATAALLAHTAAPLKQQDIPQIGAAVATITSNLPDFSRDVKVFAALLLHDKERGNGLIDAARRLCRALDEMLKGITPGCEVPRVEVLKSASRIGDTSHQILSDICHVDEFDKETYDILMKIAKGVATAAGSLIVKARDIANQLDEQNPTKSKIIASSKQCALASQSLMACTKVVAPTIKSSSCQRQITDTCREVSKQVDSVVNECRAVPDEISLGDLNEAARQVGIALNDMLKEVNSVPARLPRKKEEPVEAILEATDRLFSSEGDAGEMFKQAKVLAQATKQLINDIKGEAKGEPDSGAQNRLLVAAKVLAEATGKLVESAKGCASNPNDTTSQQALKRAAEDIRIATSSTASNAIKNSQIRNLYISAKQCSQVATQNIAAVHGATGQYTNSSMEEELKRSSARVGDMIPQVVEGMINLVPENRSTQMEFVKICERFVGPAQELASISRSIVGTVKAESSAIQLSNASRELEEAVSSMRQNVDRAQQACESTGELDTAIDTVKRLIEQVHEYKLEANRAQLRPLPGESSEQCITQMNVQCKEVNQAMSELLSAGEQGNEQSIIDAARELSSKLRTLLNSVRGVASTTQDNDLQMRILDNTKSVLVKSIALFEETKWALSGNFTNAERSRRLSSASQHVEHALSNCVYCLPGQRDIDECVRSIIELSEKHSEKQLSNLSQISSRPYGELQSNLQSACSRLLEQASNIVAQYHDQSMLVQAAKQYSSAYKELYSAGIRLASSAAASSPTSSQPSRLLASLRQVAANSSKLLIASKNAASDLQNSAAANALHSACRTLTDSVNDLLSQCLVLDNPAASECDNSLRRIQAARLQLNNVLQPLSNLSYFNCMQQIVRLSSKFGEQLAGLGHSLGDQQQSVDAIRSTTISVCELIEKSAHAAYLIGAADPSSIAGKPALVNLAELQDAHNQIEQACKQLTSRANEAPAIIDAASKIAKYTSDICNVNKSVLALTNTRDNPALNKARKTFVQLAKDVANETSKLVQEIKLLDSDPESERNRQSCDAASERLLQNITKLIAFSNAEFAGTPAKLTAKARENQTPVIECGRQLADQSIGLFESIKQQLNSDYANVSYQLSGQIKLLNATCKQLIDSIKDAMPGQKDCDRAIDTLTSCIREIDQTSLNLIGRTQPLGPREPTGSIQTYRENLCNIAKELNNKINNVRIAGQSETENLGHSVNRFIAYFEPLTQNTIHCAQNSSVSKNQMLVLNQTKAICENALHLMYSVKQCAGNPNASQLHVEINDASDSLTKSLGELINQLENAATSDGQVNILVDSINQNMRGLEQHFNYSNGSVLPAEAVEKNFVDHQTKMVNTAKELARIAQDIVVKCNSSSPSPQQLASLTGGLSQCYEELSKETFGAISSTGNLEIGNRIKTAVQALGGGCVHLTRCAGDCQSSLLTTGSIDAYAQQATSKAGKQVTEQVGYVLAALQSVSRGTQACINAISTIQGIIGDLNTTIMFATAGTLNPENENEEFSMHREEIIRTAQNLTEDTKSLITSTSASQEQLAVSAQNSVHTIKQLADIVKQGATSFGSVNSEAQVLLLNSVKDVAAALCEMISAAKSASGKNPNDQTMMAQLKDASHVLIENVTSMLKTVKTVEDEHLRGTRALEATMESINQELRSFDSGDVPRRKATPEQLVNSTKPIHLATSKLVAAGNSLKQEDIIVAANMGRKAISDLLVTVKQAAWSTDQPDDRRQVLDIGRECALQYRRLLEIVHQLVSRPMTSSLGMSSHPAMSKERQQLADISRNIAASITRIGACAEQLKGADWVNPSDPTVIAETELLGATSAIEAAAMKLASLRPRRTSVRLPHEDMNFDEMILDAAKCITAATQALLQAASAAQRELNAIYGSSTKPAFHSELDGQWSNGLISAARHVAAATHSLVEAANALVQGNASEEKLISAAKQVASSTASLLVACKVKSGTDSTSMNRLQQAGNAVKRATEMLVKAAQKAKEIQENEEDEQSIVLSKRKVPGIAQEIVAREEIIKKEKELEEAREKLALIHKSRYTKQQPPSNNGYN